MQKKWQYIDIHTHILPYIDDGASSMEESLEMLELAYQDGIRVLFATPHYGKWNPEYKKENAYQQYNLLKKELALRHPDMRIFMGNEIYYSSRTIDDLQSGKACALGNTNYVLIEFSEKESYEGLFKGLQNLVYAGYWPILAHAERYKCLRKGIYKVQELVENGSYIQINARSFLGGFFDRRASWCIRLFENNLVHFIASDCHNCNTRTPGMRKAAEKLLSMGDERLVERIVRLNAVNLILNKCIEGELNR